MYSIFNFVINTINIYINIPAIAVIIVALMITFVMLLQVS